MFSKRTNWKLEENAYTRALTRHRQSGRELLDLTASNPTECGFKYDEAAILTALHDPASLRYDPEPKGLPQARAAIVEYYRQKKPAVQLDPECVVLTTGTSEAYSFLFRLLCDPGDEILVAHPSYPLFDFLATIHDVKLCPFHLVYDHGWQIDFQSVKNAVSDRTRAILVVHPNNPTGNFIGHDEAEQLHAVCVERKLVLIVDEVFLDYDLRADSARRKGHSSFISNNRTLTFVLSGLSKIAALPQMKLAWIAACGPDGLVYDALARLELIADTYLSLNAPAQYALPALLSQRFRMQSQLLARIKANLKELDEQLARQALVSRLEMDGGWYGVLRVPVLQSDEALAIQLLEKECVLVHPGHFYDFSDDRYLVVSVLGRADEFKEGIRRLLERIAGL
ncbi:MAG TPA: pyridoxal phosphate-dependent aminotransferase [Candidatus Acidoferrales bacterium]|nr:pyridoxal phosphate-dependent aminotransferase [Candidatus Acidoferrales bacterium]